MTTKSLTLDIWQKNHAIVKANQGEVNSRFLEITLTDKSVPLDLTGKTVIFYATKPDGNVIFNSCEIKNAKNGTVTVCLTSQMSAKPGIMPCEVHIIDNEKSLLKAVGLELEIVRCADLKDAVESKSEFTALEKAMAEYESASEKFNFHLDSRSNPHEVTTAQIGAVPTTRTINSKALNSDIELTHEDVGAAAAEHTHAASDISSGALPIENGGTGATTASAALSNLGAAPSNHAHSASDITSGTLPIARGGTGGTDIYTAQSNLGLLKRYPDFSHLTLPETLRDVRDIFRLMENNSYIETTVGSNVSSKIQAICPVASGCLKIVRFYNQYTGYAEFYSNPISENSKWVGSLHNDRGFVWNKVYTSNCIIPIENGGTGAATQDEALVNLGTIPVYTTTSSFISYPCTTSELIIALPYPSILILNVDSISASITDLPCSYGILTVHKRTSNRIQIIYNRSYEGQLNGNNLYFGNYNSLSKTVTWNKIFTNYSGCQVPIENGGTGASTAVQALENLGAVPQTRTINSKDLSSDIELNCADIGAAGENHVHDFSELVNTPTTLAGYGITDVLSNEHTHTFDSIEEKPTTLAGYGITDAVAQSRTINSKPLSSDIELTSKDVGAAASGHKHSASDVTSGTLPISRGGTGATTASAAISNLHGVEATTSEITYYISPSGSNSNSGKSSSSPFKTLAYALSKLPKFLKHDVTINVAQGTYTENEVLIAGFVGEGTLSIVGTAAANAVGAENYIFSNGIKINKNQGRVEFHGIGSSDGFRVFNSPNVVFYYCHAYSPSLVSGRAGFFSTHSKVFTVYCRATNIQNGFHSYQGGDLTAMCGVCTNCSYPWCSGEGAVLYVYGASSSGFTSAYNYSSAGILVGPYGGMLGM